MICKRHALLGLSTFALVLLAGCSAQQNVKLPPPLALPPKTAATQSLPSEDTSTQAPRYLKQTATPHLGGQTTAVAGLHADDRLPPMDNVPVHVNVQNLPVPVLANEVFGKMLGLNMTMDPAVAQLQELVTLNTQKELRPQELFRLTRQVLAEYGVAVNVEGDLVRLQINPNNTSAIPPLIVSGRALPNVPISHRPVFQLIELDVVGSNDAARWLTTLFGQELKVSEETGRNAVLISGKPQQVQQAISALRVYDRPLMRGRVSTRLEPAFMTADQLTDRLIEVLRVQGYSANRSLGSPSSMLVLPLPTVNSVLLFATSQEALDYAASWARELDRPGAQAGTDSMFYYQVKNTKAIDLAKILTASLGGMGGGATSAAGGTAPVNPRAQARAQEGAVATGTTTAAAAPAAGANAGAPRQFGPALMVDEPRNALIYQGDPAQWERLRRLIQQMDRAPRQVMIEVTIAEVTLDDDNEYGLSWFAKHGFGRFGGSIYQGSGSGGANPDPSGGGLTYLLDVAGQNRLALTAFARDNRVSIISTPRLLVKSGNEANIDIGTEVPTITMQTTSDQQTGGNTNLLQAVQYRKTGVILKIKPTIYSDDRIDLDITQEVSEALPLESDATANSPSIFNRALNTSLSLRDGGSVVMGGLISSRTTDNDSGIPFIKDVPILGNLFKSRTLNKNKTELVLMIVPYIIESDEQAYNVTQAIVDQFDHLELEQALRPPPGTYPNTPGATPATPPRVLPGQAAVPVPAPSGAPPAAPTAIPAQRQPEPAVDEAPDAVPPATLDQTEESPS